MDQFIVSGHVDGSLNLWDMDGELYWEPEDKGHQGEITDLQVAEDSSYFITSSKDKQAKIWSVGPDKDSNGEEQYLTLIKTFLNEPPLNSAALIPGKPYVLCGGGQDAMAVTTTSARQGNFEIRFWHRVFEEEVARVKGGFGPCNTLVKQPALLLPALPMLTTLFICRIAVHPKGKGYSIGGEDGYVRVHQ